MTHASCPEEIQAIQKEHDESKVAKAKAAKEKENQKGSKSTKGILHQFLFSIEIRVLVLVIK